MAYGFIQGRVAQQPSSSASFDSGAWASPVTVSSLIAYFVPYVRIGAMPTITVTGNSNTFVPVGNVHDGFNGLAYGYAMDVNAGTTQQTVSAFDGATPATIDASGIILLEYSGLAKTSALVGSNSTQGSFAATTDAWTVSATPSAQPAAVVGFAYDRNSAGISAGTGYSARSSTMNFGSGDSAVSEDKRITALSAVAALFTHSPAGFGDLALMIFKEASAASPRRGGQTGGMKDLRGGMR
jgi:hypothetical protein